MADYLVDTLAAQAQQAASAGRHADAEKAYRKLASNTHVVDFEYDEWIRGLASTYRAMRCPREAGHCFVYLHQLDAARAVHRHHAPRAGAQPAQVRTQPARSPFELAVGHLRLAR